MNFEKNRAFKYGDGLFESMRLINAKVVFLKQHFERLHQGMKILNFEIPRNFSEKWIESEINMATSAMDQHADLPYRRVRMSVWRNSSGFYTPEVNNIEFSFEFAPLPSPVFRLNTEGLTLGIYEDIKLSADILSGLKTSAALPYVMAAMYKKKMAWDDALLLNCLGNIAEASASNLFLRIGDRLITPAAQEGPVLGICRRLILENAREISLVPEEGSITFEDFKKADEIWLSNAISGIRWVKNIIGIEQEFKAAKAAEMTALLNQQAD